METVELAKVAAVLADPSRAAMCLALLDGRAWTVGELAKIADLAPSTASEHVATLAEAHFVTAVRQGRHRYVRIADPSVAELVERVAQHARLRQPRGFRQSERAKRLALARTCYDHLAGRLGVALRNGMLSHGLIDNRNGLSVTDPGRTVCAELGIDIPPTRRPLLRECLDWTERVEHLAGALPAAILRRARNVGWIEVKPHRVVRINATAAEPLARLGVDIGELSS